MSGRSLSDLVESYLKELTNNEPEFEEEVPDEFEGLFGVINLPASMDDKAAIRSLMIEKHKK